MEIMLALVPHLEQRRIGEVLDGWWTSGSRHPEIAILALPEQLDEELLDRYLSLPAGPGPSALLLEGISGRLPDMGLGQAVGYWSSAQLEESAQQLLLLRLAVDRRPAVSWRQQLVPLAALEPEAWREALVESLLRETSRPLVKALETLRSCAPQAVAAALLGLSWPDVFLHREETRWSERFRSRGLALQGHFDSCYRLPPSQGRFSASWVAAAFSAVPRSLMADACRPLFERIGSSPETALELAGKVPEACRGGFAEAVWRFVDDDPSRLAAWLEVLGRLAGALPRPLAAEVRLATARNPEQLARALPALGADRLGEAWHRAWRLRNDRRRHLMRRAAAEVRINLHEPPAMVIATAPASAYRGWIERAPPELGEPLSELVRAAAEVRIAGVRQAVLELLEPCLPGATSEELSRELDHDREASAGLLGSVDLPWPEVLERLRELPSVHLPRLDQPAFPLLPRLDQLVVALLPYVPIDLLPRLVPALDRRSPASRPECFELTAARLHRQRAGVLVPIVRAFGELLAGEASLPRLAPRSAAGGSDPLAGHGFVVELLDDWLAVRDRRQRLDAWPSLLAALAAFSAPRRLEVLARLWRRLPEEIGPQLLGLVRDVDAVTLLGSLGGAALEHVLEACDEAVASKPSGPMLRIAQRHSPIRKAY